MIRITFLFLAFAFSKAGKGRLKAWRSFRAAALDRAYVGLPRAEKGAEA